MQGIFKLYYEFMAKVSKKLTAGVVEYYQKVFTHWEGEIPLLAYNSAIVLHTSDVSVDL